MKRLITDTPATNAENLLNFAYAENGDIYIRDFNGEKDVNICDVVRMISKIADKEDILDDVNDADMMEAFIGEEINYAAAMLMLATQAAELRGVVKRYEDLEEAGRLVKLPCKAGDAVFYFQSQYEGKPIIKKGNVSSISIDKAWIRAFVLEERTNTQAFWADDFGKTVFPTRKAAEAALEGAG